VTHFLTGWALANCVPSLERKERAMVALACVIPDVDGLGVIADLLTRNSAQPTEWFHVTPSIARPSVCDSVAAVCFVLARRRWRQADWCCWSFHLHLFEDVLGAAGRTDTNGRFVSGAVQPVRADHVERQWALNCVAEFCDYDRAAGADIFLAWKKGFSPLEIVSVRADEKFVGRYGRDLRAVTGRSGTKPRRSRTSGGLR